MRLLIVAEGVPNRDPVHGDGSSMISYELIRSLPQEIQVTLATFPSGVAIPDEISARCEEVVVFGRRSHFHATIRSLFSRLQIGAEERSVAEVRMFVAKASAQNDVTLLHGPHVQFAARQVSGPAVLQVVDPWSLRTELEARATTGALAVYRRFKARRLLAFERSLPRPIRLLTVGRADAASWAHLLGREVHSIANGVDASVRAPRDVRPPSVCFVGSLNYQPNVESACRLIEEVAPLVWRQLPEARFMIAGRQPDDRVLQLRGGRVEVLANVPSIAAVFNSADVAVFPDRAGLGVRNSVREALAAGIPVVATPTAAREIEPNILLTTANRVDEIADQVVRLLRESGSASDGRSGEIKSTRTVAAGRTWADVAGEYVAELELARSAGF